MDVYKCVEGTLPITSVPTVQVLIAGGLPFEKVLRQPKHALANSVGKTQASKHWEHMEDF